MTEWDGPEPNKRTHGYNAGQFIFESDEGLEKLWPKIAISARDGTLNIAPDYTYSLKDECVVTAFEVNPTEPVRTRDGASASAMGEQAHHATQAVSLLDTEATEELARQSLIVSPRFAASPTSQHRGIRLEEQSQFETAIRTARRAWIAADWGADVEGFLAVSLERLSDLGAPQNAFLLRCEEANDLAALESLFPQQLGFSLSMFCNLVGALPSSFLILDSVQPTIWSSEALVDFQRFISAVAEYALSLLR